MTPTEPNISDNARYGHKETARLLGISPNTLRSYVKQGKIKCGYRRTNGYPYYTGRAIRSCWAAHL